MKKALSLLAMLALLFSLAACGDDDPKPSQSDKQMFASAYTALAPALASVQGGMTPPSKLVGKTIGADTAPGAQQTEDMSFTEDGFTISGTMTYDDENFYPASASVTISFPELNDGQGNILSGSLSLTFSMQNETTFSMQYSGNFDFTYQGQKHTFAWNFTASGSGDSFAFAGTITIDGTQYNAADFGMG